MQHKKPATVTDKDWFTKEEAAEFLGAISVRRIEELINRQQWVTKKEKYPGRRQATRLIRTEDLKAYKAAQSAPTIDHATGQAVARTRLDPARSGSALVAAGAIEKLAIMVQSQMERRAEESQTLNSVVEKLGQVSEALAARLPSRPAYEPYQRLTLAQAAKHVGLPRTYLLEACTAGRLPFVWVGGEAKRRRLVRAVDVENLDVVAAPAAIAAGRS